MFLHFDTLEDLLAAKDPLTGFVNSLNDPSIDKLLKELLKNPSQTLN